MTDKTEAIVNCVYATLALVAFGLMLHYCTFCCVGHLPP